MPLTTQQATAVVNLIKASVDPTVVQALLDRNDTFLQDWVNAPSTFWAWRTAVTQEEIMQNGFDWVRVDNLSVGKARIWEWMFQNPTRSINPSKDNVRLGIEECWSGAANNAIRAAIYVHCKKLCSRAEALFAIGTGTQVTPGVFVYVGPVGLTELSVALNENP